MLKQLLAIMDSKAIIFLFFLRKYVENTFTAIVSLKWTTVLTQARISRWASSLEIEISFRTEKFTCISLAPPPPPPSLKTRSSPKVRLYLYFSLSQLKAFTQARSNLARKRSLISIFFFFQSLFIFLLFR